MARIEYRSSLSGNPVPSWLARAANDDIEVRRKSPQRPRLSAIPGQRQEAGWWPDLTHRWGSWRRLAPHNPEMRQIRMALPYLFRRHPGLLAVETALLAGAGLASLGIAIILSENPAESTNPSFVKKGYQPSYQDANTLIKDCWENFHPLTRERFDLSCRAMNRSATDVLKNWGDSFDRLFDVMNNTGGIAINLRPDLYGPEELEELETERRKTQVILEDIFECLDHYETNRSSLGELPEKLTASRRPAIEQQLRDLLRQWKIPLAPSAGSS